MKPQKKKSEMELVKEEIEKLKERIKKLEEKLKNKKSEKAEAVKYPTIEA